MGLECEEGCRYSEGCDGREEWLPPDDVDIKTTPQNSPFIIRVVK